MIKRLVVLFVFLPLVCTGSGDLRAKADAAWGKRDAPSQTMLAIEMYETLASQDPDDFQSRIMLAQATYWAIEQDEVLAELEGRSRMPKDRQAELADKGIRACEEILAKDENHMEANYWIIWNMAARTLAKGIFSGFAFKEAIVGTMVVSSGDITYQHGGIYRYWARVIFEIPGLLGKFFHFSNEDTVWLYRRAIEAEPDYLRNHLWLAEAYERMDRDDLARKEYKLCAEFNVDGRPDMAPENRLYQRFAKSRLKKED